MDERVTHVARRTRCLFLLAAVVLTTATVNRAYAEGTAQAYWAAPGSFFAVHGAQRNGNVLTIQEPIRLGPVLFLGDLSCGPAGIACDGDDRVGVVVARDGRTLIPARKRSGGLSFKLAEVTLTDDRRGVKAAANATPLVVVEGTECLAIYGYFDTGEEVLYDVVFGFYEDVRGRRINLEHPDRWVVMRYAGVQLWTHLIRLPGERVPAFVELLKSESNLTRAYGAHVLGAGGEPAVKPLVEALRDAHAAVRANAATSLGVIGDRSVLGQLKAALASEADNTVRIVIGNAIKSLEAGSAG